MSTSGEITCNEGRQGLRPWILARLNTASIEGLCWCNQEKTIFQIPWTHKGKQEWNEETGRIFVEYEKHTGRYQEGSIKPFNYSDSKQRLRSALGKSNDFRHVKDVNMPNVRKYRVVQRKPARTLTYEQPSPPFCQGQSGNSLQAREILIPASVADAEYTTSSGCEVCLPSDLENIHTSDMLAVAPASEPMIVSIDMLSKSMGSMEISTRENVSATRKILLENGHCSAVMCPNVAPRDCSDETYARPMIHQVEHSLYDLVYHRDKSAIPSSIGNFSMPQFLGPPTNCDTVPLTLDGRGFCDEYFQGDALRDSRFTEGEGDAWIQGLHGNTNADAISSEATDQWETENQTFAEAITGEWTLSDFERIATDLSTVIASSCSN